MSVNFVSLGVVAHCCNAVRDPLLDCVSLIPMHLCVCHLEGWCLLQPYNAQMTETTSFRSTEQFLQMFECCLQVLKLHLEAHAKPLCDDTPHSLVCHLPKFRNSCF